MKQLLNKELNLTLCKAVFIFFICSAMTVIPNYPLIVSIGYSVFAIFTYSNVAAMNKDLEFTMALPVSRKDIVKSKTLFIMFLQAAMIIVSVPFSVLANVVVSPQGNLVGFDPNMAFYGAAFMGLGIFNLIFLPMMFKKGGKAGKASLIGLLGFVGIYLVIEIIVHLIPALRVLDSLNSSYAIYQAAALAVGLAAYALLSFAAYKKANQCFDKVSI